MPSRHALLAVAVLAVSLPTFFLTSLSRRHRPEPEPVEFVLLPPTSPWKED